MINSRFNRIRGMAAAAALAAVVATAVPTAMLPVLAATGTVTGTDINVRSSASSDSSKVGTVTSGDTLEVGETETDASGATWYQVTLSDGTTGYVRGDFLTVDDTETETTDEEGADAADAADTTTDAEASDTEGDGTDEAAAEAAAAAEEDTGGYQIVLAPDENGANTYYLYDNNEGKRMKISDIQQLEDDVATANAKASAANRKFTVVLIAAIVAVIVLVIAVIILAIRLKDALENGRRERDLTMERRDQRRSDHRVDSVESLRRPRTQNARGRSREDAYASNTVRRVERDPRDARGTGERSERRAPRPAEGGAYTTRQRSAAPARDSEGRTASRTASAARPAASQNARPAADAAADRPARSTADSAERRSAAAKPAARPAAKNFAEDDFDYDFLKLDDGE